MVGIAHLGGTVIKHEHRFVLNFRLRCVKARLQRSNSGDRLHHRSRLIDTSGYWVDEAARVSRGHDAEVVGVVGGPRRGGDDRAGVGIHHDGAHRFGIIGNPSGRNLLLNQGLQRGVNAELKV